MEVQGKKNIMAKILTWNVNSIRTRIEQVKKIINKYEPDFICLQETKVINELFPLKFFRNLGYPYCYLNGIPSYNGVCIISKYEATKVENINWCKVNDGRHVGIEVMGIKIHSLYFPAGGDIPDIESNNKFKHKLEFFSEVTDWSNKNRKNTILCGDFNVAPFRDDVWSHSQLKNVVSHTEIERNAMNNFQLAGGWIDAVRKYIKPPENVFTWWSYRSKDYKKNNRGRRLDHIWVSKNIEEKISNSQILKQTREWEKPSDHVPILFEIKI